MQHLEWLLKYGHLMPPAHLPSRSALIRRLKRAEVALRVEKLIFSATEYKFTRYPAKKCVRFIYEHIIEIPTFISFLNVS